MRAVLCQIDAFDPVGNAPAAVLLSSVDEDWNCTRGATAAEQWWPVIARLPSLRYDLFDGALTGRIQTPGTSITFGIEPWPNLPRWNFADARVRIWTADAVGGALTLRFDGRATGQPRIADGLAELPFAVDDRWLDEPLLATYAGTGGVEGEAALKGVPKQLALGAPRFAPATLIDGTNLVLQLSAYGAIEGLEAAFERALRFPASVGDFADYPALVAAAVPAGRVATSKAAGLVRHGAPPVGLLSYHLQGDRGGAGGWSRLPGALIARIAEISGASAKVNAASLAALDVARPWPTSWIFRDQITRREAIQRIAASVNAAVGVDWLGKLFAVPIQINAPTVTLDATGEHLPPVARVQQLEVDPPFWRVAIESERTWALHGLGDIAFTATLVPRGDYVAGETYREGNIVQHHGASWLYINPAPSSGNAPPNAAFWQVMAEAGVPGDPGAPGAAGAGAWTPILHSETARDGGVFTVTTPAGANDGTYRGFISAERYVGTTASFRIAPGSGHLIIGLDPDPLNYFNDNSGINYDQIDYMLHRNADNGLWYKYLNGAQQGDFIGSHVDGAIYTIEHRGSKVVFLQGSTVLTTFAGVPENAPLGLAAGFEIQGAFTDVAFGRAGIDGENGLTPDLKFRRSAAQPAAPAGVSPAGWSDGVPAGTGALWVSRATKKDGALVGTWSTPQRINDLTFRGEYSGVATYYLYDTVTFNGGSYVALVNGFAGAAPSGNAQANTHWDVLAAPGPAGTPATPPSGTTTTLAVPSANGTVNLRSLADANGYAGGDANITFDVNNGVTVRGVTGGVGIDTGSWPTGYSITLTLNVNAGGVVDGGGGEGGHASSGPGGPGGDAIFVRRAITITNAGTIRGGGGGGGAGYGQMRPPPGNQYPTFDEPYDGGGGGGGGAPNGPAGVGEAGYNGGNNGANGAPGTLAGGGAGGGGFVNGAAGGTFGAAGGNAPGSSGGAGGYSIRRNGHAVTYSGGGTKTGTDA
jgi:hypothetical protein